MVLKLFFGLTMFDVMDAMTGSSYGHGYAQDTGYSAPAVVSAPSAGYDAHTTYSARSSGGYNNEDEEVRNLFILEHTDVLTHIKVSLMHCVAE